MGDKIPKADGYNLICNKMRESPCGEGTADFSTMLETMTGVVVVCSYKADSGHIKVVK